MPKYPLPSRGVHLRAGRGKSPDSDPSEPSAGTRPNSRPPLQIGAVVATLAPGLVVFALPTVGLIARNREFFDGDYAAGRDLYLLSLLVITIGFALWWASRWPLGRFLWTCYLLTTPAWFVYSALTAWDRNLAAALVTISILIVAWMAQRSGLGFTHGIEIVSVMLLIGVVVTTAIDVRPTPAEAASTPEAESNEVTANPAPPAEIPRAGEPGDEPNIYHVVMDEYQTEMFELSLDPDLEEALSGFVYFPEARTAYGRTEMSMASILGADDYDYESSPQDYVEDSLRGPDSSLTILSDSGYTTAGYAHLASLYGSPSPFEVSTLHRDFVEEAPDSASTELLTSLWLYTNTPSEVAERLLPEDDYSALAIENLLPSDAPPISAWSMQRFIDQERHLAASGRYSLVHLLLPHYPYVLSEDCVYTEGQETSPLEQAGCANRLIAALIDELKRLGRFDDSIIVIQGDHGARFQRQGNEIVNIPQDFEAEEWNDARSRAVLLIKPASGGASNPLIVSDYPASLTDIMPTVFDSASITYLPRDGRTSLLAGTLPERATRYYHFYDKAEDGLPDGELARFIIEGDAIRHESVITLPSPTTDG